MTYIDGFNLYFGLKSKGYERYLWLNVKQLAESILIDNQRLVRVHYFMSRVSWPADKVTRQSAYMDALSEIPGVSITFGKYERSPTKCPMCHKNYRQSSEKQTDVNIAVQMMADGFADNFDTAMLVSGDSDISPAVRALRSIYPSKSVVCAFPPNRVSNVLRSDANTSFVIGRKKLADCQLPDEVTTVGGIKLNRPASWS